MKFEQLYNKIISEATSMFRKTNGFIQLPKEYLTKIPQVKQCLITGHCLQRYRDKVVYKYNIRDNSILYRNLQEFLYRLLNSQYMLKKIDQKQNTTKSMQYICSTTRQYAGIKGLHLCLSMKINSNTLEDGSKEYYVLFTTCFTKTGDLWYKFQKQGHMSKQHPEQMPALIVGENIEIRRKK